MAGPVSTQRRRWLQAGLAGGLGLGLGGCSIAPDQDHTGDDAPAAGPLSQPVRTAWVFSSGGPRGFVHIGVLKALDELGLAPDLVVGASVGALVGVLYAGGLQAPALEDLALNLQPWQLLRLSPPWADGDERLSGAALAEFVRLRVDARPLQALSPPAVCVAQRQDSGEVVAFSQGDAGLAVQASAAIEGQFTPVRIRGHRHVDADLRMPLPVRVARALGAKRVLAVDASAHEDRAPPGAGRYRVGDLAKRALTAPDAALADVLLHPDFGYWVNLSRDFRERSIAAGYRDAMAAAPALRAMHGA
jgi:NTE family protein